ncbi:hypothetical protein [Chryseobacterium bernardetii]|uniref:hypothetical protein n=1 Tax=Chryseobacterium bernardetii TaxID=1241978 RepID=UPI000F514210|nr:hypothetical protein [Chryseobacterium bernardetii]AZB33769.1 hypothetical protein EG351_09185 [Chryseobacterium bernardetii]
MLSRINIYKIIKAHYKSLSSLNGNGISFPDIILFIIVPSTISVCLTYKNISIQPQISSLTTALSILAGFLFNLLAIIQNALTKIKDDVKNQILDSNSLKVRFANEIHANISYNILIAIITFVILVIYGLNLGLINQPLNILLNSICYFLLIHFFLTLLMILNRIYILLDKD